MKKLVLATAVAALSITAAQAAPTVYGKAFLTLDAIDGDFEERTSLNSNYSRIGFRGSEALTANTDLVYQLEYGIEVDENSQQFKSRDTYLGLANKQYGTLLAGRLKAIDSRFDYVSVGQGKMLGGDSVLSAYDAPRANNALAYVSPSYNDVQFLGMYVLDELSDRNADKAKLESVGGDAFAVGVKYEPTAQPYRVGIVYTQASQAGYSDKVTDLPVKDSAGNTVAYLGENMKAVRVSGSYDLSPATTVGALYQHTDLNTDDNENAFAISAHHRVANTPWAAYGQLDFVDNAGGDKDGEAFRATLGGKYSFNRNTTGHIFTKYLKEEYANEKQDGFGVGTGIEYRF